jgi:hypothetical protein
MAIYRVKLTEASTEDAMTIAGLGLLERGVEREIELTEAQAKSKSLKARGIKVTKKVAKSSAPKPEGS